MQKFWDLFEQSIITQSIITVLVVGVWLYLVAAGRVVPETLNQILALVVGFYFGSKVAYRQGIAKAERSLLKRSTDYTETE
jgi:carbon starvation protein CstA